MGLGGTLFWVGGGEWGCVGVSEGEWGWVQCLIMLNKDNKQS